MDFPDSFPWIRALWHLFTSKPVRIIFASVSTFIVFIILSFRIESWFFQRRVNSILSRMAQLRLDETPEAEFKRLLPELMLSTGLLPGDDDSGASLRYNVHYNDTETGPLVKYLWRLWQNDRGTRWLYCFGHRFHRFHAGVEVRDSAVVRMDYHLWIDTNENHNLYSGAGIHVIGMSRAGWRHFGRGSTLTYDDLRPYVERHASNAPENYVALAFTPEAPMT